MKYFLMETEKKIVQVPQLIRWYEKIDIRDVHLKTAYRLPDRELVFIKSSKETLYTDIITKPVFLVSEQAKKIVQMYEPKTVWKELVLLDQENEKVSRYFLPVFEEIACLSKESVLNMDGSEIKKAVLMGNKVHGHNIFQIAGVKKQYIVGNLDIVESMLKRNMAGIAITELEIVWEEDT